MLNWQFTCCWQSFSDLAKNGSLNRLISIFFVLLILLTCFCSGTIENLPHMKMSDLWTWLQTKRPKLNFMLSELYLMFSIFRLIEMIAGNAIFCNIDFETLCSVKKSIIWLPFWRYLQVLFLDIFVKHIYFYLLVLLLCNAHIVCFLFLFQEVSLWSTFPARPTSETSETRWNISRSVFTKYISKI